MDLLCIVSSHLGEVAAQLADVFACVDWGPLVAVSDRSGSLGGAHGDDRNSANATRRRWRSDSILVAACNHRVMIDFASWRRFEGIIDMPVPDAVAREKILTRTSTGQDP